MSIPIRVEPLGNARNWSPTDANLGRLQRFRSPQDFPLDRFYYGVLLEVAYRLAVGVAAETSEHAESPQSILENARIFGQHRFRNETTEVVNMRGADCFTKFGTIYRSRTPLNSGALGLGTGNKDVQIFYPIIFPPQQVPYVQQAGYLLDAPNYEWLEMDLLFGDQTSHFNPGGTSTHTWTAFGSATGAPIVRVHRLVPTLGDERAGLVTGLCRHYYDENISTDLTSGGNKRRLFTIQPGNAFRAFILKTGHKFSAPTLGLNPFDTLSDSILTNLRFMENRAALREYLNFVASREYLSEQYEITVPTGFGGFEFAEYGDVRLSYDTAKHLLAQQKGQKIDSFIESDVAGAAGQALVTLIEEIVGGPVTVS